MSFAEFLAEQEKRIKLFGLNTPHDKRGGARQSPGQFMAVMHKAPKPYKPSGLVVPGEIYGKRKEPNIMGGT